jgi:putative phosphoribosyl transferase
MTSIRVSGQQEVCINGEGVMQRTDVMVEAGGAGMKGGLAVPAAAAAMVKHDDGSGSRPHNPRNRFVADAFNTASLATLFSTLHPKEETIDLRTGALHFDIRLLAERLTGTVDRVSA